MLSKRFPFAIYYKVAKDQAVVYAVLDCRRNPAWIRKKLGGERNTNEETQTAINIKIQKVMI